MTLAVRAGLALLMSITIGCAHVPPSNLIRDRFDYGQSVADSWKRQTLLNVVRMRYADAPVFMDVTTVINTYSMSGSLNAGGKYTYPANGFELPFGGSASYSNTPTVTYQPLTGDKFMKSLLRPIPPVSVFQMLEAGWSADTLLRISLRAVNGLENEVAGRAPDPRFDQLLSAVTRLQQRGGLHVRVEETKAGEGVVVALPLSAGDGVASDRAEVQRLLGLEPGAQNYSLAYGAAPRSPTEIAVLTRSMLEIMVEYGFGIDVPETERTAGRAITPRGAAGSAAPQWLVHVQSGPSAPADAYTAVPYRGRWYWIDDQDLKSKVRFSLLMILSSLAETGVTPNMPVITVPSR
jgi:hypothetical protein